MYHISDFIDIKDVTMINSSGIGRNEAKVIADPHSVIDGI
jgi:hypothetical protein